MEDEAETYMIIASLGWIEISSDFGSIDHGVKVKFLSLISDIDNPLGILIIGTVTNSSEVSGIITIAAIRLLHHQRDFSLWHKDALGPIADGQNLSRFEIFDHWFDEGVVERLSTVDYFDVKSVVNALELFL